MFQASRSYRASADDWNPYGMPDGVVSSDGFSGFVQDPLKAHAEEFRMAGDGLMNFMGAQNAYNTAQTNIEISEELKPKSSSGSSGGGGGGGIGSTIGAVGGAVLGNVIAPGIGGGIGSAIGKGIGSLFG
jgi:hypothetical protein